MVDAAQRAGVESSQTSDPHCGRRNERGCQRDYSGNSDVSIYEIIGCALDETDELELKLCRVKG
jgi:hypothetical protein